MLDPGAKGVIILGGLIVEKKAVEDSRYTRGCKRETGLRDTMYWHSSSGPWGSFVVYGVEGGWSSGCGPELDHTGR